MDPDARAILEDLTACLSDAVAFSLVPHERSSDAVWEAQRARVDWAFERLHELLTERGPDVVPLEELAEIQHAHRFRLEQLPETLERLHFDHARLRKIPTPPSGERIVGFAVADQLRHHREELRYRTTVARRGEACDCGTLRELRLGRREPSSPKLQIVGPHTDGFHLGEELRCGIWGSRWFRGSVVDDLGGLFWEPLSA